MSKLLFLIINQQKQIFNEYRIKLISSFYAHQFKKIE